MENIMITASNMSELVSKAFQECLFKEKEDTINPVIVKGIRNNFEFHPKRLEEQRELVTVLVTELPEKLKKVGYTFMSFCMNKNGEFWTDDYRVCEQLIVMAIGLDLMSYIMSSEMWAILPGGLHYIIVK